MCVFICVCLSVCLFVCLSVYLIQSLSLYLANAFDNKSPQKHVVLSITLFQRIKRVHLYMENVDVSVTRAVKNIDHFHI